MVSVIACPSSTDHETIYQSTSTKLAALKDYFESFHLHLVHLEDEIETSSGIFDNGKFVSFSFALRSQLL